MLGLKFNRVSKKKHPWCHIYVEKNSVVIGSDDDKLCSIGAKQ